MGGGGWVRALEEDAPRFNGLSVEPRRNRVHLTIHCLQGDAHSWWLKTRTDRFESLTWKEFQGILYGAYFPYSLKEKLEDDLKRMRQGDRFV